jgi:ADP-ribose pyrophosphatase YjhB (NUDIX family)
LAYFLKQQERTMIEYTGFNYCPSCGKNHIEVHQKNAMECRSCGYVYFHNVASAAAGIIEIRGNVLLTVRGHEPKKGMYDLPGGFVDYNESVEHALVREVREELGIDVVVTSYLGSFPNRYEYRNVVYFSTDIFMLCSPCDERAVITPSDEIQQWDLFSVDAIPFDRLGFESNIQGLELYRQKCRC